MTQLDKETFNKPEWLKLILAHIFQNADCGKRAKEINLNPSDFVISATIGLQVFRPIAEIAFEDFVSPPPYFIAEILLQNKIAAGEILPQQTLSAASMLKDIYAITPDAASIAFVLEQLVPFLKVRRETQVMSAHFGSADDLFANLSKLQTTIASVSTTKRKYIISPFANASMKKKASFIPTGIPQLDLALGGGLGRGELCEVIGYSGGGKTTLGVMISSNVSRMGFNCLYVSREELVDNIKNRFRANNYNIKYGELYSSKISEEEMQQTMDEQSATTELMKKHLRMADVRDFQEGDFTAKSLLDLIELTYREENWAPALVVIDQLEFMKPIAKDGRKYEKQHEEQPDIVNEVDVILTHHMIGGVYPITVVLLHQARGKSKMIFTTDDISGSKYIIKPADLVIGIGRKDTTSLDFNCFSLKTRHSGPFRIFMSGDTLEYMKFNFDVEQDKTGGTSLFTKRPKDENNTGRNMFAR